VSFVLLTDCDLGDPDVERTVLAEAGIELVERDCRTEDEVIAAAEGAVGMLVQYAPIGARVLAALPQLQAIVRYGVGLDTIDLAAAADSGVRVLAVPDYCTDEVADHTLALLLSLTRGIVESDRALRAGEWPEARTFGTVAALRGRRIGLVGFGRAGQAVGDRCRACGAEVVAYDPYSDPAELRAAGVEPVDVDEVFRSDVVSLHLPLTEATAGFVDARRLALMPPHGILLNVSRGGLVDEAALLEALEAGRLGAAGLDVLADEPAPRDSALRSHPRVALTPHIAFYSPDSLARLRRAAAERLVAALAESRAAA
jgi:D-3-phosphoglycerate dehydrogenase / 2-oxoglutarate reductase